MCQTMQNLNYYSGVNKQYGLEKIRDRRILLYD